MSQQVLHIDFIALKPETTAESREQLIEAAAGLAALSQVRTLGVIEADAAAAFDLAFYFVLPDFTALEPFGTDARYSRFLQGAVAPRLRAFAGADVRLDADFEARDGRAACVAVMAPETTYDWEMREALEAWAEQTGGESRVIGLAVGERQQYRGLGIVLGTAPDGADYDWPERFRATSLSGRTRRLA